MKNAVKLIVIIAIIAIGFSMTACDGDGGGGDSVSVNITVNSSGNISIQHGGGSIPSGTAMPSIQITTNLSNPNNSFTLTNNYTGDPNRNKDITGLTPGQVVSVTAKTSARKINSHNLGTGQEHIAAFTINHY
ncbi:MAG: hypothetical protein FWD47_11315 [Treponema sp.]|nr:hypothetical protein [Treponema sp.]